MTVSALFVYVLSADARLQVRNVDWWFEGVSWTLHGIATFAL